MAHLLHRLGAFSARRRRLVVLGWLVAFVTLGVAAGALSKPFSDAFSIPGTESQKAIDLIEERTPGSNADGASGRVVFAAPSGGTLAGDGAAGAIERAVSAIQRVPGVASASRPSLSEDGRVAYSSVQFALSEADVGETQTEGIDAATAQARDAGVRVEYGGAVAVERRGAPIGEALGVLVAMVVLAITFGSLLAAGLPLISALVGVGLGVLGIMLASGLTDLSSTSITLAGMLGLAVGIDYTLFILSRHRTQVFDGMEREASIAKAVGTAGSAVVFAGLTVIVALVALVVTGVPFLAQMGIAAAATIAIAVLVSLTLVPALLSFAGARVTRGKNFSAELHVPSAGGKPTLGARWIALVMRRRWVAIPTVVVVLLALALPAADMRLGLPSDNARDPETTQRQAYDLLTDGFGPGFNGPLTIVAELPEGGQAQRTADDVAGRLAELDDVASVAPPQLNPARDLAIVSLMPSSGPDAQATEDLVDAIRDDAPTLRAETGASVSITGPTATNIDVSQKMSDALIPYLTVIVLLAVILLMLAFRSLVVPITAIGGFLLTILASFGAVVLVFQEGHLASLIGVAQSGPIISLLPILVIGVLFGLAMDYQVFLVSRMREDFTHGATARDAVRDGFRHGARVVTAAALIMVSVFAGFILPDDPIIKSMGFAFAIGIVIDAFLIRMTLIPALMAVLGERAWWLPRWLDRALPNVDIEGAALEREERRQDEARPTASVSG